VADSSIDGSRPAPLETSSDRGARVMEFESGVKHVIAKRLVDHSHLLGNLMVSSRDFV
jgi:hypothetical protein